MNNYRVFRFELEDQDFTKLKEHCKKNGLKINFLIQQCVLKYLKELKK